MEEKHSAIIIGVSSDIGMALSRRWLNRGDKIIGTYRTENSAVREMKGRGANLISCNISDPASIRDACQKIKKLCPAWDVLVMCPASLEPIALFTESTFEDWENSVKLNFINQMQIIHELLPARQADSMLGPRVLFFSAGGINDAPTNYSAYTISKIATVKMCELLAAEIPDTSFVSIGPGWVKTKIHNQTLEASLRAGINYQRTLEKLKAGDFTPMEHILDCCDWVIDAPKKVVSGRNISVVHDNWGKKELEKKLAEDQHLFKLRKYGSIKK